MRILLIGEYSRLHNSLKEGLITLGHDVVIVGNGDGFKNYPVDIKIDHSFHPKLLKKFKVAFYKLTSINLGHWEIYFKAVLISKKLKGFDVVQLINESPLKIAPKLEIKFLKHILKHNKKLFLLSCGIDYQCVKYMLEGPLEYNLMSPYKNDNSLAKQYQFQLQYLNHEYKALHDFLYEKCHGVIATDMDYHLPLIGNKSYLGLIPNPINTDTIAYIPLNKTNKIKIFHGINKDMSFKKGNTYFSEALEQIKLKYDDKVEIITTYSLPYKDYIKFYNDCDVLLDQVYSYDQGYNALEAMAKGKVVFTGGEQQWLDYYNIEEDTVIINAKPDVDYLVKKISWLIEHPENISIISKNARQFIEEHHHYLTCTQTYLKTWNTN